MSPRKSGHWASLKQAMQPVQNQEENNSTDPIKEENVAPSSEQPATPQQDDFDIPRDAFSLFSDEEEKADQDDASEDLLIGETEDPPAKESEYKWNAVEIQGNEPAENDLDGDFDIPRDAFSLFVDEDEQPKPAKKKSKKQSSKDAAPVEESESAQEPKAEKPDKVRKPRKSKKSKSDQTEQADVALAVSPEIPEDQISESIAVSVMDDSVIHSADTQTPVFYPVHQIEVTPVSIDQPESESTVDSTPSSSASLLDELIPDSEIDRVNQKAAKKEKKNGKKAAKSAPAEEKPAEKAPRKAPEPILDSDFDIPADAFSMFDDEDEQPKPKAKKPAKKEKPGKAEKPVEEPAAKDDDFDIPADAFSMFDDEDEPAPAKAPKAKPEKAEKRDKKAEKKEKKFEKRAKKEERFEDDRDEFADNVNEYSDNDEVDEYEERPRRQPKQKPARERRYVEDAPEPSRESADVREGEPRRPTVNIPSWREVMDTLVAMNLDRRKASERPSRPERQSRSRSAAARKEEIEEIEDRFEREDVERAPRRRRRRPE